METDYTFAKTAVKTSGSTFLTHQFHGGDTVNVNSLKKAMTFFLNNSSGSVLCVKDSGETKKCNSYPEAVRFFSDEPPFKE
jgi:hypothetical protein